MSRKRMRGKPDDGHGAEGRTYLGARDEGSVDSFYLGSRRYEVIERLSLPDRGRWAVRDHRPPPKGTRRVAIVLPGDGALRQLHRSLSRLPSHANSLPTLIDHGRLGKDYCLIVEWIPGIDLREYLLRVGEGRTPRPSPTESVRLVRGLAHSLRLLHQNCGVIHGDLKPANLILTVKPSSLRVIDFGSSWQVERTRARLPGDGSDPTYAAPEFFDSGGPVSAASDQFSVGVILYQMLTQQIPFEGLGGKVGHPELRSEFDGEIESPSRLTDPDRRLPGDVRREIDSVLRTMLRLDPNDRFPNSGAWTDALDHLSRRIDHLANPAYRSKSLLERAARWWLRLKK